MCIGKPKKDPAVQAELDKQRADQTEMDIIASEQRRTNRDTLVEGASELTGAVGTRSARQSSLISLASPSAGLLGRVRRGGTGRKSLMSSGSGGVGFYSRFKV